MSVQVAPTNPVWTWLIPFLIVAVLAFNVISPNISVVIFLLCLALFGCVITAVHHAEVIAHKVGEPFGTLVLALSVTSIEVALIISMMLSIDSAEAMALPRDTIFAAVMIILNAMVGINFLIGGLKHHIQRFHVEGMTEALSTMTVIITFSLILPNYILSSLTGYTPTQLGFVALMTLVLFCAFTFYQTHGHRDYFIPVKIEGFNFEDLHAAPPTLRTTLISLVLLILSLVAVVLCAKSLSPTMETLLNKLGAPAATLGIIIAAIVLLPEFGASLRNALANRIQSSLNLAIGSAIASIGLTIPVVAIFAIFMNWELELGLDKVSSVLLVLTLFVVALSLRTGKTNTQSGIIHLALFAAYLFFSFMP